MHVLYIRQKDLSMSSRRIIFYVPESNYGYYGNNHNYHQGGKLISSKIDISGDFKITSMETLIRHPNSTLEKKPVHISNLANLVKIQNCIKSGCGSCLNDTCVHAHRIKHPQYRPLVKLSKKNVSRDSRHKPKSVLNCHPTLYFKETLKPKPPLVYAIPESLLRWINESRLSNPVRCLNFNEIIPQSTRMKEHRCNGIYLKPLDQATTSSSASTDSDSSSTPHDPNQLTPGSIALKVIDWDNFPMHPLKEYSISDHSSENSDPTLKFNPNNLALNEITPLAKEPSSSSDIDGDEENYKTAPKICLSGCLVESDSQYFYIFSQPMPNGLYFDRNR